MAMDVLHNANAWQIRPCPTRQKALRLVVTAAQIAASTADIRMTNTSHLLETNHCASYQRWRTDRTRRVSLFHARYWIARWLHRAFATHAGKTSLDIVHKRSRIHPVPEAIATAEEKCMHEAKPLTIRRLHWLYRQDPVTAYKWLFVNHWVLCRKSTSRKLVGIFTESLSLTIFSCILWSFGSDRRHESTPRH